MDPAQPICIDCGSGFSKAGFGGDDAPRTIFPTIFGTPRHVQLGQDCFVGDQAQSRRGILHLHKVVERGNITNWDQIEKIWDYAFRDLKITPSDRTFLMMESPSVTPETRLRVRQIMFETFTADAFHSLPTDLLSVFASGRTTALSLGTGDGVCHASVVWEGDLIQPSIQRADLGGSDLLSFLVKMLIDSGTEDFQLASAREVARDIKEKHCRVAPDFQAELDGPVKPQQYEMPDGMTINLGAETFRCPEALFQPAFASCQADGVHQLISKAVKATCEDRWKDLLSNIIVAGGPSNFPGFAERLTSELQAIWGEDQKIKVIAPPARKYLAWMGASTLSTLAVFQQRWTYRSEYEERGPNITRGRPLF